MMLSRRLRMLVLGRSRMLLWLHCLTTICFLGLYLTFLLYPRGLLRELEELEQRQHLLNKLKRLGKEFPALEDVKYSDYQLNATISNSVPLDRAIPDTRPDECAGVTYDLTSMSKISVIIPVHNELWSMLLRTVYSVINKTPSFLLHEIIIVDDCSTHSYLKGPLDKVAKALPLLTIIRRRKRDGLVQARMDGARKATGQVLVFLDGHVECNTGWIEPLLDAIAKDPKTIAFPHIDSINTHTLDYTLFWPQHRGVFNWKMEYIWQELTTEKMNSLDPVAPILSPTTVGCAFAVRRDYFFDIGAFDEDMLIWGGENLELSFRVWMCGGSLYMHPCSTVGHIFRNFLPYGVPYEIGGLKAINKNYQRLAEVWMDDYKSFYYAAIGETIPITSPSEINSLEQRKELRARLRCKNFRWYLTNIYPEAFVPWSRTARFQGQIKNLKSGGCMSVDPQTGIPYCDDCDLLLKEQHFSLNHDTQLALNASHCLTLKGNFRVVFAPCRQGDPNQVWTFDNNVPEDFADKMYVSDKGRPMGTIRSKTRLENGYPMCLTQTTSQGRQIPMLMKCKPGQEHQHWIFTYKFDFQFADKVSGLL